MAKQRFERIGNYTIFLDKNYFISYAGGSRELDKKNQDNWDRTKNLPGLLQVRERNKLGLINNPNVVPIKGVDLLSFIREIGFVPFFDRAFNGKSGNDGTGVLQLTDVLIFEKLKATMKKW